MESKTGFKVSPNSLKAYSTLGGTSGYTVHMMIPSDSRDRRLSVNTFWLIPSRPFFSSLKRQGRASRFLMISSFHLLPINSTVAAAGQMGISSFVSIRFTSKSSD